MKQGWYTESWEYHYPSVSWLLVFACFGSIQQNIKCDEGIFFLKEGKTELKHLITKESEKAEEAPRHDYAAVSAISLESVLAAQQNKAKAPMIGEISCTWIWVLTTHSKRSDGSKSVNWCGNHETWPKMGAGIIPR